MVDIMKPDRVTILFELHNVHFKNEHRNIFTDQEGKTVGKILMYIKGEKQKSKDEMDDEKITDRTKPETNNDNTIPLLNINVVDGFINYYFKKRDNKLENNFDLNDEEEKFEMEEHRMKKK
eukprot:276233_1